ncbi:protein phosphatase 2C domain-containing protein [Nocardioides sp. CN2-186]|uniref:PP2C family protein-serine/threonine phosphatase n=1 Tax=Nocardioides tweenelious TaxID=3156607 RepID=UPI0032B4C4EB
MTDSPPGQALRLHYAAVSDVGRVRKDNQDSGYAGPWLLAVCDGVGGAARGDIASSTAITQLRRLDAPPTSDSSEELLARVAGALHRAHDRLVELVDEDPALDGTSTTATVAVFDGLRLGIGHVGDSRGYLFRDGAIRQLTVDHTFVQTLIDEGRITEEEARVHPHRNLILRAIDAVSDSEPDLFIVDLAAGDRVLLCSDGASGVLPDGRLADILSTGSPEFAAVEMVRASLEAGSSDNVTCVVADVVDASDESAPDVEPVVVGAAAERRLPRARSTAAKGGLFRGHRAGDTGELEPVPPLPDDVPFAISSDPVDPEAARYAPRPPRPFLWLKRICAAALVVGVVWVGVAAAWSWSQDQYFVGEQDGKVVIYRGINASLPGVSLSSPYQTTDVEVSRLSDFVAGRVSEGIDADSLEDAQRTVQNLAAGQDPADPDAAGTGG